MQIKRLIWILVAVVVVSGIAVLVSTQFQKTPSQEMIALRQVEKQVSPPDSKTRSEEDLGENIDSKGARHYSRYILLQYAEADPLKSFIKELPSQGWTQVDGSELEGTLLTYKFMNEGKKSCVGVQIQLNSTDSMPHSIAIQASSDDSCSVYFQKD